MMGVWIIAFIVIFVLLTSLDGRQKSKRILSKVIAEYNELLTALENDPSNTSLRKMVLKKGRERARLSQDIARQSSKYKEPVFDETALRNDIDAVTASIHVPVSCADEIGKLSALARDGVITKEELESLKAKFTTKPVYVHDVIQLLKGLNELQKEGALTENEFNMKKWDILSKKISY